MPPSTAMEELNPLEIFDAIKNMIDRPDFSAETIALIRAYLNVNRRLRTATSRMQ